MKHIALFALLFTIMVFNFGEALSQDLSANIMRRVNAANLELDKAEEQIQTGKSELAPAKLKTAQTEYDNIFNYYKGSFDPNHPILVKLKERIVKIKKQLSEGSAQAVQKTDPVTTGEKKQAKATDTAKETSQTKTTVKTDNTVAKSQGYGELSANIRRRINSADVQLTVVNQRAAKGERSTEALNTAKAEYQNIFNYYKGSFDPNHPDIIALKQRIDDAEKAMNEGFAKKNASALLETNPAAVEDLPEKMGDDLISIAGTLRTLENRLDTANKSGNPGSYVYGVNDDLKIALDKFEQFNSNYKGQFNPAHVAYVQVETRLKKDQKAVSDLEAKAGAAEKAEQKSQQAAYDAKAKSIVSTYKNQEINSALYKKNIGRMVWATSPINFDVQDKVTTKTSFKLTDPIFGRIYLKHSLGNTPVYSTSGGPQESFNFGYEFKLFIDGKEKADRSDAFTTGMLNGQAGETWRSWQFAPNPVPYDESFRSEADAWRRVTKGLSPGTHAIRFELWATQGQLRSREPICIGEFSLIVKQGDRVSAGLKFPQETYSGNDAEQLGEQLKQALATGKISYSEIVNLAITGDWVVGRYTDSKKEYRKISAAVLFEDKDNDGVCRFVTYNFISDKTNDGWTAPRFHSFCNGCPEGDVECPK